MSELTIEKGISIPAARLGRPVSTVFSKMEVGDSVFMPKKCAGNVSNFTKTQRSRGMRFTSRKLVENGVSGVRVWRIE